MTTGRLLGVDVGTVRIGLAVCDPDRLVASPAGVYARRTDALDAAYFLEVVKSEGIAGLVVGLPIQLNGVEGTKAAECRRYGAWLASVTGLSVVFWDERFTSSLAEDALIAAGVNRKKRKGKLDGVAAQLMLQGYLEAGCPVDDKT